MTVDAGRMATLAYAALCLMTAAGLGAAARAGAEVLWPSGWAPMFGAVAALLVVHSVAIRSRAACLTAGLALHLAVLARVAGTAYNQAAGRYAPGRALAGVAFLGAVLLSSALVWRYLLWPLTRSKVR